MNSVVMLHLTNTYYEHCSFTINLSYLFLSPIPTPPPPPPPKEENDPNKTPKKNPKKNRVKLI